MTDVLIMTKDLHHRHAVLMVEQKQALGDEDDKGLPHAPSSSEKRDFPFGVRVCASGMRKVGNLPYYVWGGPPYRLAPPSHTSGARAPPVRLSVSLIDTSPIITTIRTDTTMTETQFISTTPSTGPIPAGLPSAPELPTILALDLGTSTGWALQSPDGLITSGTTHFRPGRYDGGGMRYLRFTHWLAEIERLSGPIAALWFEEVRRHAGTDAAHVYGGLMATLTAWAELRSIPYAGVPVGTIKRHATGKGNAPKQAMIDRARARGFAPADDNEADAIALLLWAIETNGGAA